MKVLFSVLAITTAAVTVSGCAKQITVGAYGEQLVCSPFVAADGPITATSGLLADVATIPSNLVTDVDSSTWLSLHVADLRAAGTRLPVSLYLPAVNVLPSWFANGIPTASGDYVRTPSGAILTEYFSVLAKGNLALPASAAPGLYQFAVLSDDGAVFYLDSGAGLAPAVDNNGVHNVRFATGTSAIQLDAGAKYPMSFDYFQGPANVISATLLWRRVGNVGDTVDLSDVDNGRLDVDYFFTVNATSSTPNDTWKAETGGVLSRGWSVVPAEAFSLPADASANPCATN